jgi:hypothetical protein
VTNSPRPPRIVDCRAAAETLAVPISPGELLDKISILEIKIERIADRAKQENVGHELAILSEVRQALPQTAELAPLTADLKSVNARLWDVEDAIRDCERRQDFGPDFVELARSVYRQNDRRSSLKRQINELFGSRLIEEKAYAPLLTIPPAKRPSVGRSIRQRNRRGNCRFLCRTVWPLSNRAIWPPPKLLSAKPSIVHRMTPEHATIWPSPSPVRESSPRP